MTHPLYPVALSVATETLRENTLALYPEQTIAVWDPGYLTEGREVRMFKDEMGKSAEPSQIELMNEFRAQFQAVMKSSSEWFQMPFVDTSAQPITITLPTVGSIPADRVVITIAGQTIKFDNPIRPDDVPDITTIPTDYTISGTLDVLRCNIEDLAQNDDCGEYYDNFGEPDGP